jgi:hypothetical protein
VVIESHEKAAAGAIQKLCLEQRGEQGRALRSVDAPQAAALGFGQSQSWHLEEFAAYAVQKGVADQFVT